MNWQLKFYWSREDASSSFNYNLTNRTGTVSKAVDNWMTGWNWWVPRPQPAQLTVFEPPRLTCVGSQVTLTSLPFRISKQVLLPLLYLLSPHQTKRKEKTLCFDIKNHSHYLKEKVYIYSVFLMENGWWSVLKKWIEEAGNEGLGSPHKGDQKI